MELIFAISLAIFAWIVIIYNLLVRDKNRVLAACHELFRF